MMEKQRRDYLRELAWEYDVPVSVVTALADALGPNEDYDGLVCALEDIEYWGWSFEEE